MGLAEILLAQLCVNITCTINQTIRYYYSSNVIGPQESSSTRKLLKFKRLRHQLMGMNLKIATVENGALSYTVNENGVLVGKGVAFELIDLLQDKYKFNYTVIVPKENSLGSNSSGIFSLLYNNEADLGAAFLPITSVYWKYAHFASTLDVGEWVVVLKRPHESASGSGLMAPFTLNVWLLILVSLFAVGPIMYLILSIPSKMFKEKNERPICLVDCMWFVYGALLKQGTTLTPISDSSRLVFATWWTFITILTAFYTANLTAFLTLSQFTLPIKGPNDFKIKKYPWVSVAGSVMEEAANNHQEELFHILKNSPREFVVDNSSDILKNWVTQRNYLYIAERPNVDITLYEDYLNKAKAGVPEPKRCTYVVTPWSIFKSPRAFAYSKNFKFGQLFDSTLRTLLEIGLVKYSLTHMLPNVKICPLNLGNKERQLRNTDLLLTYYIVGVGFSIAILIFIAELVLKLLNKSDGFKHTKTKNKRVGGELNFGSHDPPPPPPYETLFFPFTKKISGQKKRFNGRDYWVIRSVEGRAVTLVPVRTPSALLFQYTN